MAEHILTRSLEIDLPRQTVFDFFADAGNLERITPPDLNFHIVTPQPIKIERGTLIDYKLRLHGIPMSWQTEITLWDPPHEFVDTQLRGPYSQWVHRHTFTELACDRTLIEDQVRYRLPLEPLGDLAHFIVRSQLNTIFDHRQLAVVSLLH
jgi:ligand-binding SRPBCC domain-containing protein